MIQPTAPSAASPTAPPADHSADVRLREYLALVREMSLQRKPTELLNTYRSRARFVVNYEHAVSFSRRNVRDGAVKITRNTRAPELIDPWAEPDRIPTIESSLMLQLMTAGLPVRFAAGEIPTGDPVAEYLSGMAHFAGVPIFYAGEPLYMLLAMREYGEFSTDELATLTLTANLVGTATAQLILSRELETAYAALDREVRIVGEIQRDLLPQKLPEIPGVSIATHYETSASAGGDYYDFFPQPDGNWGIMIADVSGHGPPAAVVMAMMHAILHAPHYCAAGGCGPAGVLRLLNERLYETMQLRNFVTAFYGVLDPAARTIRYVMAGHDPPRVVRAPDRRVEGMPMTDGLPLAIISEPELTEQTIELRAGDRVLLYTDGITETFNRAGAIFGLERLDESLRQCACGAQGIVDRVLADIGQFAGGLPPRDDRTLVAIAFE
ncbi:MAG: SpoIIE family protein phosphatase [Phycisphaerales bacterium]|nr:SpoIIE family protein phosphatase [Phycisphaerales bacterium]